MRIAKSEFQNCIISNFEFRFSNFNLIQLGIYWIIDHHFIITTELL